VATVLNSLADNAASGDARLVPNPLPSLGDLNKAGIEHRLARRELDCLGIGCGCCAHATKSRSSSPPASLPPSFW
jgi:hypothetical protein